MKKHTFYITTKIFCVFLFKKFYVYFAIIVENITFAQVNLLIQKTIVMKKAFLILTGISLLLCACGGKDKKQKSTSSNLTATIAAGVTNDLQKERIRGNVDSIRQRVYWCLEKFGRMEKGKLQNLPQHDFLKLYNNAGFLIEETHYNSENKITSIKKITYNDVNMPQTEEIYKGVDLDERIAYTYDANKLAKKEIFDKDDKLKEKTEYIYYPDTGLLMDEDWYKGEIFSVKYVYLYENYLINEKQKYWSGGSLAQKEYYRYNEAEELITYNSEKYQNKQVNFDKLIEYFDYNSFGDYCKKINYDQNGNEIELFDYLYDSNGNLTATNAYIMVTLKQTEVNETEIEDDEIDDDSEIDWSDDENTNTWQLKSGEEFTYEYDAQRNWTQKITYKLSPNAEKVRQFYYERIIYYK